MLRIIRHNQQEILFERLAGRLAETVAGNPLAPALVVTEKGIDRWLRQRLAATQGIAANIRCEPPAAFLWRTLREWDCRQGGRPEEVPSEGDPWDNAVLAWRILRVLPPLLKEPAFAEPRRWLADEDEAAPGTRRGKIGAAATGRRLFQLAQRLADVFDGYLVYRPQLIVDWENGRPGVDVRDPASPLAATAAWQAPLWRALVEDGGGEHRANLMRRFTRTDDDGAVRWSRTLPRHAAIFGIPALPPAYTDLLVRLAKYMDIDICLLSPSDGFWGDFETPAAAARTARDTGYVFGVPNRLLAANGQPVRHFHATLGEHDNSDDPPQTLTGEHSLLARVQTDIALLRESTGVSPACIDDSISITSAWGPMREVEALHDRLLGLFDADPGLAPHEVIVMAPDIAAYAPCIDAVFGTAENTSASASHRHRIPYTLADVPLRGTHPLAIAFENLLRLPDCRLTVNDVLGWLQTPAIAARRGFDSEDIELVRAALHAANVRWGFDGHSPGRDGLPDGEARHTWSCAFDRLFMGLATGDTDETVLGVAPCAAFAGKSADTLGRLRDFVDALVRWQDELRQPRTAAEWMQAIADLCDEFIAGDDHFSRQLPDRESERVHERISDACRGMLDEATAARFDTALDLAAFRDGLLARLEQPSASSGAFLAGAVTFCRMTAMRSLPFKVIALLGMDASAFPRRQPRCGFDLIDLDPQTGDRARRLDDRHLFLETLLSARQQLLISYSGRSPQDSTAREPSVVVGELLDVLVDMHLAPRADAADSADATGVANRGDTGLDTRDAARAIRRRLVTEHTLQPFSRRCFDGSDPRLASRDDAWRAVARAQLSPPADARRFCPEPLPPLPDVAGEPVELSSLLRFYAHPVKAFLRERLGVMPARDEEVFEDDEPFALDALARYSLVEEWTEARIDGRNDDDIEALFIARGQLPAAGFGRAGLAAAGLAVDALHTALAPHLGQARDIGIALDLPDGRRLDGVVRVQAGSGVLAWTAAKKAGHRLLPLWIEHLALCAQQEPASAAGDAPASRIVALEETIALRRVAPDEARRLLADLVALRDDGLREPLPLFPKTSLAFAMSEKDPVDDARQAWQGGNWKGAAPGECSDEAHTIAFAGLHDPVSDFPDARFTRLADRVYRPLREAMTMERGDE